MRPRLAIIGFVAAATFAVTGAVAQTSAPPTQPPGATTATPLSPVDDFAKQVDDLKKSLEGFNTSIEGRAKAIGELVDAGKIKSEIEGLRGYVAGALGSVADNSTVAELGAKALRHAQGKIDQIAKDTRFTKEQKDFLLGEWKRITADTEQAASDLDTARREFVQLLKTLQTREDFVDELLQVQKAREAVEIIRQLSNEIRTASDSLKNVIRALKPPGA